VDRDRALEQQLLEQAGGSSNYPRQVEARLDQFEHNDGGNVDGWDNHVDRILAEAQEEAADISGWVIGAALQLPAEQLSEVLAVMRHAAAAHEALEELRLVLAMDATRGSVRRR
jgi:hypothetical protein